MESKNTGFIIGFLIICSGIFLACATDQAPLVVANSLPQSELAFYSDSFDSLKEDLWEKAGYVFTASQLANIKIGDIRGNGYKENFFEDCVSIPRPAGSVKAVWFPSLPSGGITMCRSICRLNLLPVNLIWIRTWDLEQWRNQNPAK